MDRDTQPLDTKDQSVTQLDTNDWDNTTIGTRTMIKKKLTNN